MTTNSKTLTFFHSVLVFWNIEKCNLLARNRYPWNLTPYARPQHEFNDLNICWCNIYDYGLSSCKPGQVGVCLRQKCWVSLQDLFYAKLATKMYDLERQILQSFVLLWEILDEDQWSKIIWIMRHKKEINHYPQTIHQFLSCIMIRIPWLFYLPWWSGSSPYWCSTFIVILFGRIYPPNNSNQSLFPPLSRRL